MKLIHYASLATEKPLPAARDLDRRPLSDLVALMNGEDASVARAVGRERARVVQAVEMILASFQNGGRLFLAGAGTSGRMCVLEAAECPPTFGTPPREVQALMAGGRAAVFRSQEGAEDRGADARRIVRRRLRRGDVLVGVAASGVTPYVRESLAAAKTRGAKTILLTCNPLRRTPAAAGGRPGLSEGGPAADLILAPRTGPEVLAGSTRLKAGTATKMILNMLTTLSMVRRGKVYDRWMVDLQPRSRKLKARAVRLVAGLGHVPERRAVRFLASAGGRVKAAILMARRRLSRREAESALAAADGFLGRALGE